jgi:hypothetical protein
VLQNFNTCQFNMHNVTECYQISIEYAQCYKILTHVNSVCTMSQNVIKYQFNMHSVTKF